MRTILRKFSFARVVYRKLLVFHRNFRGLGLTKPTRKSIRDLTKYLADASAFRKSGGKITRVFPIINEYRESAGIMGGHYFHQDLLVAQLIHERNPRKHLDIGSRIDGFVTHVASFREIEVLDIRQLKVNAHPRIKFSQFDLMRADNLIPITDSISCLHTIEHFGLGRYGDKIDPNGHIIGFNNLIKLLEVGGFLYISFPVGRQTEVHFNAHRMFEPREILNWSAGKVELIRFDLVDDKGELHKDLNLKSVNLDFNYGCGIYTFQKLAF